MPHLEQDGVAPEELELVHLGHGERHHGVVIVHRVLDNQTVGPLLLVQNGSGELVSVKVVMTNERRELRLLTNERAASSGGQNKLQNSNDCIILCPGRSVRAHGKIGIYTNILATKGLKLVIRNFN